GGAVPVGSAEARIWLRSGHPTGRNSGEDVGAPGGTHHPRKRPAIALEDDLDLGEPKQLLAHPGVAPIGGRAQEEPAHMRHVDELVDRVGSGAPVDGALEEVAVCCRTAGGPEDQRQPMPHATEHGLALDAVTSSTGEWT